MDTYALVLIIQITTGSVTSTDRATLDMGLPVADCMVRAKPEPVTLLRDERSLVMTSIVCEPESPAPMGVPKSASPS
jgi:hypothetical protein